MAQAHQAFTLPEGWIVESKTRKSGKSAGKIDKIYHNPSTGIRCYSMTEVLRHAVGGRDIEVSQCHSPNCASDKLINNVFSPTADVHVQIEYSPEGLPSGWIKEIRCRRSASGQRKDAYYIDPLTEYVFRSKKEVLRYLESGEIGKDACKRKVKMPCSITFKGYAEPSGEESVQIPNCDFNASALNPYPTNLNMSDRGNGDATRVLAEENIEFSASGRNTNLVQQAKSVPVPDNVPELNWHATFKPADTTQVEPMTIKRAPGGRVKKVARRRPFTKKVTNSETKVDKEQLEPWHDEP